MRKVEEIFIDREERKTLKTHVEQQTSMQGREITLIRKDGTSVVCLNTAIAVRDPSGSVVRYQGAVIAASFLNGFRDVIEAQWSSAIEKYNKLKANMFLYWHLFSFAGQKGYRTFDFGRSTVGSGTHVFKMQWGSETVPLHWDYWLPDGNALPNLSPQNPKYKMAISLWRNLPLAVTNVVGPSIVRYLP